MFTKFDTETENEGPDQILPAKLISHKIQDDGSCHIEIQIFSHNWAFIALFAPNLTQWLQITPHSRICHQNSRIAKIQDGGRHYFEIS